MKDRKRAARLYLQDILAAIGRIEEYTAGGKAEFLKNTLIQDAVLRQFSIIGEAAGKLPKAMQTTHANIPWKHIIGMRNIIIHDYADTDIPTIWDCVEKDLPPLRRLIKAMLRKRASHT